MNSFLSYARSDVYGTEDDLDYLMGKTFSWKTPHDFEVT